MEKNKKDKGNIRKIYKYFLPSAFQKYKGYFFVRFGLLLVNSIRPFVNILALPMIVDELLGNRNFERIMHIVIFIIATEFLLGILGGLFGNLIERYTTKFENYYKMVLSKRIMELDFQLTEDKKALDQIEAAKTGMSWYSGGLNGIVEPLFNMASSALTLAGVTAIIVTSAPLLLVVILVILLFAGYVNAKRNVIEQKFFAELSKENRITGYMGWHLTNFKYGKDIRLYAAKEMMVEKWNYHQGIINENWSGMGVKQLPLELLLALSDVVRDFGSYFYVGALAIFGKISIATCTQLFSASGTFYNSMRMLVMNYQELCKRANYAYEYVKFMDYPAVMQKGDRHIDKDREHIFELRDVHFSYPGSDVSVLNGVNLTLHKGEHLAVVGLNGAGKTTLIKLLCRLYEPTSGEILLDGVNITQYDYDEYMELFAPVFQDFQLFAFSMKENLVMGREADAKGGDAKETDAKEADAKVADVLTKAGLAEKIASLPNGVETVVYKHFDSEGIEPSGGEQQKLAIARALYKDAPVVILDEPTAALDPMAEYEIYRQFEELVKGKIAIYISHRLSSCQFCDRIAVFSEGAVKEYGTHEELVNIEGGLYAEMFGAQAQYYYG
ncbi:MAG: ABC transporter ATP-binding protein [Lachnospiraceae bacterium]|nr:ABC transporter ATP-binding protein [Lachnospiraceae bacterium]